MKQKSIILFLIFLAVTVVAVIVADWYSKRPDQMQANKFEYSVEEFKDVPGALIQYRETRNFNMGFELLQGIAVGNERIYVAGDQKLKIIDRQGNLLGEIDFDESPNTIAVLGDSIFVAFKNYLQCLNHSGNVIWQTEPESDNSIITSIAVGGANVFVADAGTRRIIRFTRSGEKMNEFEGKESDEAAYGFIIPSPFFDVAINAYGDLWVVNPGLHTLEHYTPEGRLREHWKSSGINIQGFSGCCNPAHFTFLSDGSFVTAEKGMVRIKTYKPSGEFAGVVAPPEKFTGEGTAPDIATDRFDNVYALDYDKKMVRVFEKIVN